MANGNGSSPDRVFEENRRTTDNLESLLLDTNERQLSGVSVVCVRTTIESSGYRAFNHSCVPTAVHRITTQLSPDSRI